MMLEPEIERALAHALCSLEKVRSLKAEVARDAIRDAHEVMRKQGWEPRGGGWDGEFERGVEDKREGREQDAWNRRPDAGALRDIRRDDQELAARGDRGEMTLDQARRVFWGLPTTRIRARARRHPEPLSTTAE